MDLDYISLRRLKTFYSDLKSWLASKYATKEELEESIQNFGGFQVVSLNQQGYPDVAEPSIKIIYLTKEDGSSKTDPYTEWICTDVLGPVWEIIGETTPELTEMTGATASTEGASGLVPAPKAGDENKVLKGDGTWGEASSSVRVIYDAQSEELSLDFYSHPNEVLCVFLIFHHKFVKEELCLS